MGARQEGPPLPSGGGGYPDIYIQQEPPVGGDTKNARAAEMRINELREMGIGLYWLAVAESIGVDNFLTVWKVLNSAAESTGRREMYVPNFSTYTAYQRNRFIQSMSASGMPAKAIRTEVSRQLRETLTVRHILRVIAGGRS